MPEPEAWGRSFTEVTNEDAEIRAHGKYYSCSFLWDMEDRKVLVDMHKGKVERLNLDPQPLDVLPVRDPRQRRDLAGLRVATPQPMYHGIWAATFQRDMKLEGDVLVLMQNLRCLTRQIELLRATGVPV